MTDIISILTNSGPFGVLAGAAVTWAIYESKKSERKDKEHAAEMEAERAKSKSERDKNAEELRKASADILRLATEYAQARALNEQADNMRQSTMAEVMSALHQVGK